MKLARNEKCPCDSGKKYKHCCLEETLKDERKQNERKEVQSTLIKELGKTFDSPVDKKKGELNGKCNVTSCQSGLNVTFCNQWNRSTYYCLNCALRFTDADYRNQNGYRINQMVPHPILCSQEEATVILKAGNVFSVETKVIDGELWFHDFGDWFKVPKDGRRHCIIINNDPTKEDSHRLYRPMYSSGNMREDLVFVSDPNGKVMINDYRLSLKVGRSIIGPKKPCFDISTGEFITVKRPV